jgi:Cft2 family RNA processing exonuclease
MATSITFFPVDNGDMTLICLGDKAGTTILIDCNIRAAADDPDDKTRDVAQDLRERLKRDSNGRPYVDVFLQSHPDQDHCRGIRNHFHLDAPADYADDKKPDNEKRIKIGEMWSA